MSTCKLHAFIHSRIWIVYGVRIFSLFSNSHHYCHTKGGQKKEEIKRKKKCKSGNVEFAYGAEQKVIAVIFPFHLFFIVLKMVFLSCAKYITAIYTWINHCSTNTTSISNKWDRSNWTKVETSTFKPLNIATIAAETKKRKKSETKLFKWSFVDAAQWEKKICFQLTANQSTRQHRRTNSVFYTFDSNRIYYLHSTDVELFPTDSCSVRVTVNGRASDFLSSFIFFFVILKKQTKTGKRWWWKKKNWEVST